jgi:hypothetical protein
MTATSDPHTSQTLSITISNVTLSNVLEKLLCFSLVLKNYQTAESSPFNSTFYLIWASIVYGENEATGGRGQGSRPATTVVNGNNETTTALAVPSLTETSLHLPSSPPQSPSSPPQLSSPSQSRRTPQVQGAVNNELPPRTEVLLHWVYEMNCDLPALGITFYTARMLASLQI